jgi:hypothetical protein
MREVMGCAIVALVFCTLALAQDGGAAGKGGIRWGLNVEEAVKEAQKSDRVAMFWITRAGEGQDNNDQNMERDQKRSFADPRVLELARRFVCCKMSASRYRKELQQWGVRAGASFDVIFVSPSGDFLGEINPTGAARPESMAQKMAEIQKAFRDKIFQKEIKPVLDNAKSDAKALAAALDRIGDLEILTADEAVVGVLKKEGVAETVSAKAIQVLGQLSTKAAADELFARAANDKRAMAALEKCNPGVVDALLKHLDGEDREKLALAYAALCKICKIGSAKPDRFWEGNLTKVKEDELRRVKDLAKKAAARWTDRNEGLR